MYVDDETQMQEDNRANKRFLGKGVLFLTVLFIVLNLLSLAAQAGFGSH